MGKDRYCSISHQNGENDSHELYETTFHLQSHPLWNYLPSERGTQLLLLRENAEYTSLNQLLYGRHSVCFTCGLPAHLIKRLRSARRCTCCHLRDNACSRKCGTPDRTAYRCT